jgi:hypothetical protein
MNEPICIARARKETTVKVKAGDWIILTNPDGTFSEANAAFEKANSPVNEDFNRIIIGKIQHTRPSQNPITKAENEVRLKQFGDQNKRVQEIAASARDRSVKQAEEESKKREVQKSKDLDRANAIAAQIRKATNYKAVEVPK